ncbi:MAG: hypothetical protein KIS92_07635 [Planctomycetota bacterium]|nr:hypothetical protein [Planctomycetota bacterium]
MSTVSQEEYRILEREAGCMFAHNGRTYAIEVDGDDEAFPVHVQFAATIHYVAASEEIPADKRASSSAVSLALAILRREYFRQTHRA